MRVHVALLCLTGCLQSVDEDFVDAGTPPDAGVTRDAGVQVVDAGPPGCAPSEVRDVFTGACAEAAPKCTGDVAANRPVTLEQAHCLGLDAPVCAGCHRAPCGYQSRPKWAPPSPAGIDTDTSRCL